MTLFSRLVYVFKEGFLQLLRARGLSTAVIVVVASTLLQLSFFLGLSRVLDHALGSAREKFEMAVFLTSAADASDRQKIQALLLADPRVASVRLVTREEALQEFRKDPEIDQMVQALGENPLTDSFTVVLRKDALEKPDELVSKLKQDPRIEEVDYGKNEWEEVSNLSRLTQWVGWVLGGFIFLTALFIVSSTLSLALWARREDFTLMARMGAPSWMRWGPYLWEGLLQGFAGSLIVVAILEVTRRVAGETLQKYAGIDMLLALPAEDWRGLYLTLILLGVILGFLGAFLALQRKWVREIH
jgi:cell division transport system permease protein